MSNINIPKYAAVIAAGGSGARFGSDIPKQFLEVNGFPVIAHSIKKFQDCPLISEIIIVTHSDYVVYCRDLVNELEFTKVSSIIRGGDSRQKSTFLGIKEVSEDIDYVLIHDAARPAVDLETIEKCCKAVAKYKSCAVGVKVVDTLKISEDGEFITSTADREKMWQIQTPQAFEKSLILKCHKNAAFENFEATDDCMIAEHYGSKIKLVLGNYDNIKITTSKDLLIMEGLL